MADNLDISNQIQSSCLTETDIKEQVLEALSTSKNILNNLKENHSSYEVYNNALQDYNNLKNEILKAYLDDKNITKLELDGLKDEIEAMNKHDQRNIFEKTADSIGSSINDNSEDCKTIEQVQNKLNKINQNNLQTLKEKDANFFYIHEGYINQVEDPKKMNEILKVFVDKGESIEGKIINKKLFNEFILKEGVEIEGVDCEFISKENLENNINLIIKLNKGYVINNIILEACKKGIDVNIIKNAIKQNNITISKDLPYINIYIGEAKTISEEDFDNTYKDKNINELLKLPAEEKKEIENFLLKNVNNSKYESIIIEYIKNSENYSIFRGININSTKIIKTLIENNSDYLRDIPNEKLKSYEIIDCYLDSLKNKNNLDSYSIVSDIDYINKGLNNIEGVLYIFTYLKTNSPDKYDKIKTTLVTSPEYLTTITELLNKTNSDLEIKTEYKETYNDIINIINNDLNNILGLRLATNEFNITNLVNNTNGVNKESFKLLSNNLSIKLEGLNEPAKTNILNKIESIEKKFENKDTEEIYNILKNAFPNYKTNPEFKKYFDIILNEIKEFNIAKVEIIAKSLSSDYNNEFKTKDKEGKEILNTKKLQEDFSKLIEGKTEKEQIKIREQFIKENFANLSPEEKAKINEILDLQKVNSEITFTEQNFEKYVKYMELKEKNPSTKIDFKNFVENETKMNNVNNNYFITKEQSYIQAENGGYTIIGKNGEPIKGLVISEDEKKLTLGNPEATENLVNFFNFFKELNLESVWTYRKELFQSMGSLSIKDNNSDFINNNEMITFGNKLLTFIENANSNGDEKGEKKNFKLNNLGEINKKLRNFSQASTILNKNKTFNKKREDRFADLLRQHGIIGGAYFRTQKLIEMMK